MVSEHVKISRVVTDGGTQTASTEHPTKVCIDLFSGLGGFSAAFADAVETRQPTLFDSATDNRRCRRRGEFGGGVSR